MFPWTFSMLLSFQQHARRSNPEGVIAARGFRLVEDIRGSDEGILAPMRQKNVRQLTYRDLSQKVDAERRVQPEIETKLEGRNKIPLAGTGSTCPYQG
jgi:hypothetical protein